MTWNSWYFEHDKFFNQCDSLELVYSNSESVEIDDRNTSNVIVHDLVDDLDGLKKECSYEQLSSVWL